ncbi:tRNA dihydrouridine synthase DusB [Glaciecola siphonariae]|uniref:tRNA-dihydrouridine synthase B n=1 Tax=Glaciecola siphonariae TaxID=521012 RepID=A0ABV9LS04_9ALTE
MQIGPYRLSNNLILAPMAGITDRPFRELCRKMGAGLAVSEMLSSNPRVWQTEKSMNRMNHEGESGIRSVQIAGSEPELMAQAAKLNVDNGAQIIDINMGCPAKKVNKKLAGSALLQDPALVARILDAVVKAVEVPVTLKIRTGWDVENKNGVEIARIAQSSGIQSLAVHGRTRSCMFKGGVEYDTIKAIKDAVDIPIIANGDICNEDDALRVLEYTGADGIMIGRAAQGNPWIFQQIQCFLENGKRLKKPSVTEQSEVLLTHMRGLYELYGEFSGVRIARKHVGWYVTAHDESRGFRRTFNAIEDANEQLEALTDYFSSLHEQSQDFSHVA